MHSTSAGVNDSFVDVLKIPEEIRIKLAQLDLELSEGWLIFFFNYFYKCFLKAILPKKATRRSGKSFYINLWKKEIIWKISQ